MIFLRALSFLLLYIATASANAAEQHSTEPTLGLINASQERYQDHTLEFWGYHDSQGSGSYADTLKLRYYNPLNLGDWHGTVRLDTAYTAVYGPQLAAQSTGTFSPSYAMLTIWGGQSSWFGHLGARVSAPLGNAGQWLAGPQVITSFRPADNKQTLLVDISPLARYMFGFSPKAPAGINPPPLASHLELYQTIGLNLSPSTQIRFLGLEQCRL
ncbi:hypothetical protein [Polynucleobacter necessarius]|uniref:hypothetical protein n=1 Tax=Polynucleobacter necessarius TaxID=576610 RepID=UPI000E095C06|nr:hypothetical protein [Polynucleobacter necessarius]